MFSKISRYRRLPDVVTVDAKGRRLESKSLRLSPRLDGRLVHTLEEGERLDHLAYKYYRRTRDWWRICDANPQLLSPWELLGTEPRTTLRIEVTWAETEPPWPVLLADLRRSPGVEDARLGGDDARFPAHEVDATTDEDHHRWSLTLTFNEITTSQEHLVSLVEAAGFEAGDVRQLGRVGKPLVIPPRGR